MSEEVAEQKKKEIEELEVREAQIANEIGRDSCPLCGRLAKDFEYLVMMPPPFGWLECPGCGCVFCPSSLRKEKLQGVKREFVTLA